MSDVLSPPVTMEQLQAENARLREEIAQLRAQSSPPRESFHTSVCSPLNSHRTEHDAFVSNLSHELRTPMHGLLGSLYLLADSTLTPEQTQHLEVITSSTNLLQSLILDLLDFSAVHTGAIQLSPGPISILELIEVVMPMCSFTAENRQVYLCYWIDPECMLRKKTLDGARVEQIMLHLVSNAIKFTKPGGTVTVKVSLAVEKDALSLVVSDTGIGMPPSSVTDLHRPFGSARQHSLKEGLGVGLSVVWRLVEAMEGSISCESVVGEGTSFQVCLPAPSTGPAMTELSNPFGLSDRDRAVLAHSHVAIVSPDHGSVGSWSRLMRLYGSRVVAVDTLEEVKAYARRQTALRNFNDDVSGLDNVLVTHRNHSTIDLVILDGYREVIKHCKPNEDFKESDGLWSADRNSPIIGVEELNATIRAEVATICRLLLVFVSSKYQQDSSRERDHPVSLLSLVAGLRGDRISCSMRPVLGQPLTPVFEGSLVPVSSMDRQYPEGPALLTAELFKPFNHRPFLCKVSAQLQRLPMSRVTSSADHKISLPTSVQVDSDDDGSEQSLTSVQVARVFTPGAGAIVTAPTDSLTSPLVYRLCDMRIMVVEDNLVNQKLIQMFLYKLGCRHVLMASSGGECLELLRQQAEWSPDTCTQCIFMDISMDPMDGRECTRHIRSELTYQHGLRPVFIVAQTANCTDSDRVSYKQCGMDDYLPKPISLKSLTAALARAQNHILQ